MKNRLLLMTTTLISALVILTTGCADKAFVRGTYDKNLNQANLLSDRWSETDMQTAVQDLVNKMTRARIIKSAKKTPVVMVTRLQNKTHEHIDTQSITDMLRVELMNATGLQFVDKAARDDISEEYNYQNSGMVTGATKKGPGGQVGADYIINGRLDSIVQQAGGQKTVYYKLTLNMTNLKTSLIVWTGQKQIRKMYEKQRVSM